MNDEKEIETEERALWNLVEWLEHDTWTVHEGLYLLANWAPPPPSSTGRLYIEGEEYLCDDTRDDPSPRKYGKFDYVRVLPDKYTTDVPVGYFEKSCMGAPIIQQKLYRIIRLWESGDHPNKRYPIDHYLKWAEEKGIHVPWLDFAKKKGLLKKKSKKGKLSDIQSETNYLNEEHPFFAKEFKIAVQAWTELYEKNPPSKTPKGGHRVYIEDWLKGKYPNLSKRAIDRIAGVINSNPKEGATPT